MSKNSLSDNPLLLRFISYFFKFRKNLVGGAISIVVTDIPVTDIQITAYTNQINIKEKLKLSTTVYPENATNKTYYYESSDETIATVSAKGVVTAKKAGEVEIYAISTDGSDVEGVINLTVIDNRSTDCDLKNIKITPKVSSKWFSPDTTDYILTLNNYQTVKITPQLSSKKATYKINGEDVKSIKVSPYSDIKKVKIKVRAENGTKKTYKITIKRK